MKYKKRIGLGLAGIVTVALVLALATPKAVHAMVAALVRDVDNPARLPTVTRYCYGQNTPDFQSVDPGIFKCDTSYTVPAGQRLVIEQVDGVCYTPVGTNLYQTFLDVAAAGQPFPDAHKLVLSNQGSAGNNKLEYALNQPVRYYADPGSTLFFVFSTTDASGSSYCTLQVNGYLISYP